MHFDWNWDPWLVKKKALTLKKYLFGFVLGLIKELLLA